MESVISWSERNLQQQKKEISESEISFKSYINMIYKL
jgi:hypothetical protein